MPINLCMPLKIRNYQPIQQQNRSTQNQLPVVRMNNTRSSNTNNIGKMFNTKQATGCGCGGG